MSTKPAPSDWQGYRNRKQVEALARSLMAPGQVQTPALSTALELCGYLIGTLDSHKPILETLKAAPEEERTEEELKDCPAYKDVCWRLEFWNEHRN